MASTPWSTSAAYLTHPHGPGRRSPSQTSQYDSGHHSPEHSQPDSLDHMDMGVLEGRNYPILHEHDPQMYRIMSRFSSVSPTQSTAPPMPVTSATSTISMHATGHQQPVYQYSTMTDIDITMTNSTGMFNNDPILTTAATPFHYPTTTANPAHQVFQTHSHPWTMAGPQATYVPTFSDEIYMYNVQQQPGSPGASIISSSHSHSLNHQLSSPIDHSPASMKATRSFSQDEPIMLFSNNNTISPEASFMSNQANIGSPPPGSESWHSEDGYVMIPTPSRDSSGSPVLVTLDSAGGDPSSPSNSSSASSTRRKKEPSRKTAKASSTKTKQSSSYTELTFGVEKATPAKVSKEHRGKKAGGRPKGSHLDPETADHARLMRTMGNCWVCIFQREKCIVEEGSNICIRCRNRQERGIMDCNGHLGCINQKLSVYQGNVVPDVLKAPYGVQATYKYQSANIYQFLDGTPIKIELSLIYNQPPIQVKLHEYQPRLNSSQVTVQWTLDPYNDRYVKQSTQSVPLALRDDAWKHDDVTCYDDYLDDIVNDREKLRTFGDTCYQSFSDNFLRRLFQIFMNYEPHDAKEDALLKDIYKMLLAAHVIGHVAYFSPKALSRLPPAHRGYFEPDEEWATPYLANRQVKTIFLRILDRTVKSVLEKQQSILRGSQSRPKWMGAFMCMLGMAMACEEVQSTTAMVGEKHEDGDVFGCSKATAKKACEGIDETFTIMSQLFHMKYKTFNPLLNPDADDVVKEVGQKRLPTVRAIRSLCQEKYSTFMGARMFANAGSENLATFYGRQVSRFLNGFWSPDGTAQQPT